MQIWFPIDNITNFYIPQDKLSQTSPLLFSCKFQKFMHKLSHLLSLRLYGGRDTEIAAFYLVFFP